METISAPGAALDSDSEAAVVAQQVAILLASPLFDADGYAARHALEPSAEHAARHHLATAFTQLTDPGPAFSTGAYLLANSDIDAAGLNPLVHYETAGRAEGRPIEPVVEGYDHAPMLALVRMVRASGLVSIDHYHASYPDLPTIGFDPVHHYVAYGWREGRDPSPDFSTMGYLAANPDVAALDVNPLVHFIEHGRAEQRPLHPEPRAGGGEDAATIVLGGETFPIAPAAAPDVGDAFALMAAAMRGLAPLASTAALPLVSARARIGTVPFAFAGIDLRIDDGWSDGGGSVRLRIDGVCHGRLQSWQRANATLVAVGDAPLEGTMALVDLTLHDPLAPVLCVVSDSEGDVVAAALLEHPSRLRGGMHYDEVRAAAATGVALTHDLPPAHARIGQLVVPTDNDLLTATDARWIADRFGVTVIAEDDRALAAPQIANDGAWTLHLTTADLPTIGALAGPVAAGAALAWICRGHAHGVGARYVGVPTMPDDGGDLPRLVETATGARGTSAAPLVLRRAMRASRRVAAAKDAASTTVVIDLTGGTDVVPLLADLAAQAGGADIRLVLRGTPPPIVIAHARESFAAVTVVAGAAPLPMPATATVVQIDAALRLPDSATLGELTALLTREGIAGVGCTVRAADGSCGGGYVAARVAIAQPPALVLAEAPLADCAPGMTLPVVAPSARLAAWRSPVFAAHGGLEGADAPTLALRAAGDGWRCLVTDRVAATVAAGAADRRVDPSGLPVLPLDRWLALIAATTVVHPL